MDNEEELIDLGFKDLDKIASGVLNGDMVIVGGRAATGKSVLLLNILRNLGVLKDIPVLCFSAKDKKRELMQKLLSIHAKIEKEKIETGCLQKEEKIIVKQRAREISEAPVFIEYAKGIGINNLLTKVSDITKKNNIKLIIVDDLNLIGNDLGMISEGFHLLKELAKSLQVPIIVTSLIPPPNEQQNIARPFLRDLSEDSLVEREADKVFLLVKEQLEQVDKQSFVEVFIAKNRIGPVGQSKLKFLQAYMGLEDYS